jgi:hypothetical protein
VLRPGEGDDVVDALYLESFETGDGDRQIVDTDQGDEIELEGGLNTIYLGQNDEVTIEGGENTLITGDFVRPVAGAQVPNVIGFDPTDDTLSYMFDSTGDVPTLAVSYDEVADLSILLVNGSPAMTLEGGDFRSAALGLLPYDPADIDGDDGGTVSTNPPIIVGVPVVAVP